MKKKYNEEVSSILQTGAYLEDVTEKLFSLVRNYSNEFNVSLDTAINELDLIIMDNLFHDLRIQLLRKEKLKRLL